MKKLILTGIMLMLLAGVSFADTDLGVSWTVIDSSSDYFTVEVDTTAAEDSVDSLWLLASTTNPPTAHVDSTFSATIPDTLLADGLTPATEYYFRFITTDSTGQYDTSAVDSFTTATVGDLTVHVRTLPAGYSTVKIWFDWALPDSGFHPKKTVLFYDTDNGLTRKDSILTTSHTDPDTFAVTGLLQGTTYYYTLAIQDSGGTLYYPSDRSPLTFTTTNLQQSVSVLYTNYSTAGIEVDTTGGIGVGIDSVRLDLDLTDGTTYKASITTVTYADTFKVTGLEEGATYFYRTIFYLTDSSAADTLTAASFTMTDLGSSVSVLRSNADSLIIKIDSTTILAETLIVQYGAGLRGIAVNADTTGSPNGPDTVTITGIIEGSTIYYRVLSLLVDSAAVDTGTVLTYSRASNSFSANPVFPWPDNMLPVTWEFDKSSDNFTTGPILIESPWLRIHAAVDGADDVGTYDSIEVFIWSWQMGDSAIIDTPITVEADTTTITPLKFRMEPSNYTDTSLALYPVFDWGTHYSISAIMTDSVAAGFNDSTLGVRTVRLIIETIE